MIVSILIRLFGPSLIVFILFPNVNVQPGLDTLYPLYADLSLRIQFVLGSWYIIYYFSNHFYDTFNKPFNETVFNYVNNSSFITYLVNGTWIAFIIQQIIDHEEIKLGVNLDKWYNNFYLVGSAALFGSEIMCFMTYLASERLKNLIKTVKGELKASRKL